MLVHLLKSSACLVVFLLFYQIFLERENIHVFKRYYLLAALLLALGIPFITFTEYVQAPAQLYQTLTTHAEPLVHHRSQETATNYWAIILWSVYGLGVTLFGFKFLKNLWAIVRNIKTNPKVKIHAIVHVLLQKSVVPHTFLRYIFLNKQQFETGQIPKEVIAHEKTHARQWHSIDILFVELLQIFLWFHPLVYWAKYHIKLNHEFLADRAVLNHGTHTTRYQSILIGFASSANAQDNQSSLANAINYSSIRLTVFGKTLEFSSAVGQVKKRFTVMKTHTSKKSILLRSILLLPLLALLIYGFSDRENIYQEDTSEIHTYTNPIGECRGVEHHTIRLYENKLHINGKEFDSSMEWLSFLRNEYGGSSENEGLTELHFTLINENNIEEDVDGLLSAFSGGAWLVHESASEQQINEYDRLAKKYNVIPIEQRIIPSEDLKTLEGIYNRMTETQKEEAQPFPECPEPPKVPSPPKSPNKKLSQVIPPPPPPAVEKPNLGGNQQIPPPPPPYKVPDSKKHSKELLKAFEKFDNKGKSYSKAIKAYKEKDKGTISQLEQHYAKVMVLYDNYVELAVEEGLMVPRRTKVESKNKEESLRIKEIEIEEVVENEKDVEVEKEKVEKVTTDDKIIEVIIEKEVEEVPKTIDEVFASPESPVTHIAELAKKDAVFYYKGEEINSNQAIEILQKNKYINIEIEKINDKNPVVRLSDKVSKN